VHLVLDFLTCASRIPARHGIPPSRLSG
jgi:hypothetical protein